MSFTPRHKFVVVPEDVESFRRECEPIGGSIKIKGVVLAGYALRGVRTADLVAHFPQDDAIEDCVCELGIRESNYRQIPRWCLNFVPESIYPYEPEGAAGRVIVNVSPRLDEVTVAAAWQGGDWIRRFARAAIATAADIENDVHSTHTKFYAFLSLEDIADVVADFPRKNAHLIGKTLAEVRRAVSNRFHDIALATGWEPIPMHERQAGNPYCWRPSRPGSTLPNRPVS